MAKRVAAVRELDRKSTRLNSSHLVISYAVFCLKKTKFYFSSTITSDRNTYVTIGAIFGILTCFVAIGAVIILGAVACVVLQDRKVNFFFNDTATTEIYTLSLHDALPI